MPINDCAVCPALKVIGEKRKPVLLYHVMNGKKLFANSGGSCGTRRKSC